MSLEPSCDKEGGGGLEDVLEDKLFFMITYVPFVSGTHVFDSNGGGNVSLIPLLIICLCLGGLPET